MSDDFTNSDQWKIVRHARCSFCGGRGDSMDVEIVESALGTRFRVPASHPDCKLSILSLSLSLYRSPQLGMKQENNYANPNE